MQQSSRPVGQLVGVGRDPNTKIFCPLQHTSVNASISGFAARVNVVQTFVNESASSIEAVYIFPLPHEAAVDRMRIKIGSHIVEGVIKRREEARRIYDAAKNAGQTAALLDQERPNIFTQSVANIAPGMEVKVDISYVQVLKYENGQFEFAFPMVVGPRYTGNASDPAKIAPPTVVDSGPMPSIDLNVHLDAGAPIQAIDSVLHKVSVVKQDASHAEITLAKNDEKLNRDFILHYQTATNSVQSAFVTCFDGMAGGFFDLILLPPKQPRDEDIAPREMIFVMDQSGSQAGFPIEKSKELMFKLLKTMRPNDTFNVYGFNTEVRSLWPAPRSNGFENVAQAHSFVDSMVANGGTNLFQGLHAALTVPKDPKRLRVVLFNTDGYVGDETNILTEIQKNRDQTRIFTFGIGNSINRYLIDAMSLEGKGDSEMVTLDASASDAADRLVQRLRAPILTDVRAEVDGVQVQDLLPREIPDVFSDRPVVVQGRYATPGQGTIMVHGRVGGEPWSKTVKVQFGSATGDSCVATLWARKKVDDLTEQSYAAAFLPEYQTVDYPSRITDVGLEFGIMTRYTSFVAVEPRVVNVGGKQYTVHVPVQLADGVSKSLATAGGRTLTGGQGLVGDSIDFVSYDATDNSIVTRGVGGGGFGGGGSFSAGVNLRSADSTRITRRIMTKSGEGSTVDRFERVVDRRLRTATGKVAIMIYLSSLGKTTLFDLGALGFNAEITDKKVLIVYGTVDAVKLRRIADMPEVDRVTPVE